MIIIIIIIESMTSEGDGVLLPANVDRYANSICIGL